MFSAAAVNKSDDCNPTCRRGLQGLLPKWWRGEFSPPLRGGVAARSRKSRVASLARADGVVFNLNKILRNLITTPSAPQRRLRNILLRSRPPLLEEEGKIPHSAFGQQTLQPAFGSWIMLELSAPERGLKPATTCWNERDK